MNVITSTPRSATRNSPAAPGPNPCSTFSTPGGRISAASSPSIDAVAGDCSAGLSTTVLPNASAGATFQLASMSGKFHGEIAATTPFGS